MMGEANLFWMGDAERPHVGDHFITLKAPENHPGTMPVLELVGAPGTESGNRVRHMYPPGSVIGPAKKAFRRQIGKMTTEDDGTQLARQYYMSFILVDSQSPKPEDHGKQSYVVLSEAIAGPPGMATYAEQSGIFAPGHTWVHRSPPKKTSANPEHCGNY